MSGADFEVRAPDWLGFDEARRRILQQASPLEIETVPLADALGRALAEPYDARATLPPWDNAAMDGFAVVGDDLMGASPSHPIALRVTGTVRAGEAPAATVHSGCAVRIMTGAPVPPGADSVVRVEDTDGEADEGTVRVRGDRDVGRNIRPAGEDMELGERVLDPGLAVTPGTVAALSALGHTEARVHRRPTVAILPTGDELRGPSRYDEVRAGAGVPESNGPMLAAAVRDAAGVPRCGEIVGDTVRELRDAFERAADTDVLVTIGGASMGEADLVKRVLDELGFKQDFWRVRMRPGSPLAFGWLPREGRDQAVFSLPGNPASAFATFELFVRPFLLALAGHRHVRRRTVRAVAGTRIVAPAELTYFFRVTLDGSTPPVARLAGPQGSGLVRTLAVADGLAIVPESVEEVAEGEPVDVMILHAGCADALV